MYVGRTDDLRRLTEQYNKATTVREREWFKRRIQTIQKEYNNPKVAHLRNQLLTASRKGDVEATLVISDELKKESRN